MSTIVITKLTNGLKVKEGTRKAYTLVGKPDSITPKDGVVSIWLNKTEYLYAIADTITFDGVAFSGTEEDLADSFRTAFNLNSTSVTSNVNGQATMANSAPVTIASNQSSIGVKPDVQTASGTITTQNLNGSTGTGTTGSTVELALNGASTLSIQAVGTYTSAFTVQVTNDGTNWITRGNTAILSVSSGAGGAAMGSAAQGIYTTDVSGFLKARVTALSAVTGSAVITMIATNGAGSVVINNPLPTGSNVIGVIGLAPNTAQGFSTYYTLVAAATGNATSVKTSAGVIGMVSIHNKSAGVIYFKIFNKASAPTMGTDTPVFNFGIPAATVLNLNIPAMGLRLSTGIAFALTGGQALLDNTSLAAGDAVVNISYT
jgi:hypothetical protein